MFPNKTFIYKHHMIGGSCTAEVELSSDLTDTTAHCLRWPTQFRSILSTVFTIYILFISKRVFTWGAHSKNSVTLKKLRSSATFIRQWLPHPMGGCMGGWVG